METKESIEATCPDCRGPLSVWRMDGHVEVRCLVGHVYSPEGLLRAHSETQEKALWSALVSLRETESVVEAVADRIPFERLERLRSQVRKKQSQAAVLQDIVQNLEAFEI